MGLPNIAKDDEIALGYHVASSQHCPFLPTGRYPRQIVGIQAPQFDFTAYLRWRGFREHEAELAVADLDPVLSKVVEAGRARLRSVISSTLSQ